MIELEPIEDILRKVYAYFSREGAVLASISTEGGKHCFYRGKLNGEVRMCAVGCVLREDEGDFNIPFVRENAPVPRLQDRRDLPRRWRSVAHAHLLAALQRAHDSASSVSDLRTRLRRMAKRRGIDLTQPAA